MHIAAYVLEVIVWQSVSLDAVPTKLSCAKSLSMIKMYLVLLAPRIQIVWAASALALVVAQVVAIQYVNFAKN